MSCLDWICGNFSSQTESMKNMWNAQEAHPIYAELSHIFQSTRSDMLPELKSKSRGS